MDNVSEINGPNNGTKIAQEPQELQLVKGGEKTGGEKTDDSWKLNVFNFVSHYPKKDRAKDLWRFALTLAIQNHNFKDVEELCCLATRVIISLIWQASLYYVVMPVMSSFSPNTREL